MEIQALKVNRELADWSAKSALTDRPVQLEVLERLDHRVLPELRCAFCYFIRTDY